MSYGTATVRLRARCLQLPAPYFCVKATAQLRCAFAHGVYSLLHQMLVLGLRHSYGALRARCQQLPAPGVCAWATAQLRCAFALGVYSLLHQMLVLELRHSYGAPSNSVSTASCTWCWCLSYGTATASLRARCQQLNTTQFGFKATAQLRCAFAHGVYSFLHQMLV